MGRCRKAAEITAGSWLPNSHWASSAAHLIKAACSSKGRIWAMAAGGGPDSGGDAGSQKVGRQFTSTARATPAVLAHCSNQVRASLEAGLAKARVPTSSHWAEGKAGSTTAAKARQSTAWSAKPRPRSPAKPAKARSPVASRCTSTTRLGRSASHCRPAVFTPRAANSWANLWPMASLPRRPSQATEVPSRARAQAPLAGAPPR